VHKKAWFLIVFGTDIFMRRWALSGGRGSARSNYLRGSVRKPFHVFETM